MSVDAYDPTNEKDVSEIARAKKILLYVNELLEAVDPELVPITFNENVLRSVKSIQDYLTNYASSNNAAQLESINSTLDQLLTTISNCVHNSSVENYLRSKSVSELFGKLTEEYTVRYQEMTRIQAEIVGLRDRAISTADEISQTKLVIDGDEDTVGVLAEIKQRHIQSQKAYEEISKYHDRLLVGSEDEESIVDTLTESAAVVLEKRESVQSEYKQVNQMRERIEQFTKELFGDTESPDIQSLESKYRTLLKSLSDFELSQSTKYHALVQQIESLLPSATSAGLSHAYYDQKASYDGAIRWNTGVFYFAIAITILTSIILHTDLVSWVGMEKFVIRDYTDIGRAMAVKLPIVGALVWLALFASRRRSEAQRLQQEYAHKETLAKSYEGFKKQIEELQSETTSILELLMKRLIDEVSNNPSNTLDRKHGDDPPTSQMIQSVSSK